MVIVPKIKWLMGSQWNKRYSCQQLLFGSTLQVCCRAGSAWYGSFVREAASLLESCGLTEATKGVRRLFMCDGMLRTLADGPLNP